MSGRALRPLLVLVLMASSSCAPPVSGNAAVEQAFAQHRSNIEATASGIVTGLLSDETGPSGARERFIVRLDGSRQTLLVDHNVTIGKRVPVAADDVVVVHGEYVWNDQGGLIHFTHHDPEHTHEGGWIELRGTRYD